MYQCCISLSLYNNVERDHDLALRWVARVCSAAVRLGLQPFDGGSLLYTKMGSVLRKVTCYLVHP